MKHVLFVLALSFLCVAAEVPSDTDEVDDTYDMDIDYGLAEFNVTLGAPPPIPPAPKGYKKTSVSLTSSLGKKIAEHVYKSSKGKVVVKGITKVTNPVLYSKVKAHKRNMFSPSKKPHLYYHGTGREIVEIISRTGFLMPKAGGGQLFGQGIYTAEAADYSAHYAIESKSNIMLLCDAYTGRMLNKNSHIDKRLTPSKVHAMHYDSVRGVDPHTALKHHPPRVMHVVYHEHGVFPKYQIEFHQK